MTKVHILIPAAGAARRMLGADKLLETVAGEPLLRRIVCIAEATMAAQIWVTLPPNAAARKSALTGCEAQILEVPDCAEGMSASIRVGIDAARDGSGLLIVLADMPEISSKDITQFLEEHDRRPQAILRGATASGELGHPVLIPARFFQELTHLSGDQGARALLKRERADVRPLVLPGDRAILDLDTPEDWARWRQRNGST